MKRTSPKLPPEVRDRLCREIRLKTKTRAQLAKEYNISYSGVTHYARTLGVDRAPASAADRLAAERLAQARGAEPERIIEGCVLYLLATRTYDSISDSSPADAQRAYDQASEAVKRAWTNDEWLQAWVFAIVRVAERRFKERA